MVDTGGDTVGPAGGLRNIAALDLDLEVSLAPAGGPEHVVARTSLRHMYWTMPQQLAHLTVGGAAVRPGDLHASGTVSGASPDSVGSLIELTWRGERPLDLDGTPRAFLEDGDTVVMRGHCGGGERPRIGFGEVRGTVLPAHA
jgi:fumarylacetoacetase